MSVSLLSKYSHFLCASVLAATLISSVQGNSAPTVGITILQVNGVAEVSEDAGYGTFVAHVFAHDNGQVSCNVNHDKQFMLEEVAPKQFHIIVREKLDREKVERYNLHVTCFDDGNPPLSGERQVYLDILDVNDNTPVFTFPTTNNNTAKIYTSKPLASATVIVTAIDLDAGKNGQVNYTIHDNLYPDLFQMDTNDGKGVLRVRRYPTDTRSPYTLTINATDQGDQPLSRLAELNIIFTNETYVISTTEKATSGQGSYTCHFKNILIVFISNLIYLTVNAMISQTL